MGSSHRRRASLIERRAFRINHELFESDHELFESNHERFASDHELFESNHERLSSAMTTSSSKIPICHFFSHHRHRRSRCSEKFSRFVIFDDDDDLFLSRFSSRMTSMTSRMSTE